MTIRQLWARICAGLVGSTGDVMGTESGLRRRVKGLSEAEFRQRYGTEEACRAALYRLRWGKGWACPCCGHGRCAELKGRPLYQCNRCKRQVGLTAGTVFHWTKLPLTTWFLAIYHLSQSKGGMSDQVLEARRQSVVDDLSKLQLFDGVELIPVGADGIQRLYTDTKNAISRRFEFPRKTTAPEIKGVSEAFLGFLPAKEFLSIITDSTG